VLANVVITLSAVTCTAELLGAFGLFRLAPMTVGLGLVGLGGWFAARRLWSSNSSDSMVYNKEALSATDAARPHHPRGALFAALAATSVVVADWSTRTVDALHHGMSSPDTLWYHMPFAARFVQDGSITALHFVDFGTDIAFYPQNGELFHALGILFLGNDFLSPLLNMGWLALVLLAAWCVGRPFGVAPVTLVGAAALMATPCLVATQPGGAYTDIVGFALLTSAVALLVNSEQSSPRDRLPAICLAALAAGLTLGTKLTFIPLVVALTVGVSVIAPRGTRVRQTSLWLLLVVLTGGFWYLRNLAAIGNPLPYGLHLGPISLPSPPGLAPASSVASFLFNRHDWRMYFLPGFREALGPAWWAVLGLTFAGLVLGACFAATRLQRMLAIVGIASGVGFVFLPQPLTVPPVYPHVPYNFVYNLRFSFAALIIGFLILAIIPVMARARARWLLLGSFGIVLMVTQLDSTIWLIRLFSQQFAPAIQGVDSRIGLLIGLVTLLVGLFLLLARNGMLARRPPAVVLVMAALLVLVSGFGLQQLYLRDRYLDTSPMAPLYAWAKHVQDTRMAITGPFSNDSYPLYGQDDSNYVQVVGKLGPSGSFLPILSCGEFRRVINSGRYADVITVTGGDPRDPTAVGSQQTMWISQDPAAKLIFRRTTYGFLFKETVFSVFHLDGPLDPDSCPSS
jgi:hypothetical protein